MLVEIDPVTFWLILMIIVDGIIAFYVPARRVQGKLLDPSVQKQIIKGYITGDDGIYNQLREQVREDVELVVNNIKSSVKEDIQQNIINVQTNVEKKIDEVVTNDIPHIIEEKLSVTELKKLGEELKKMHGSVMGIQSSRVRAVKEAQRLNTLQQLSETKPEFAKMIFLAASNGYKSETNKLLDMMAQGSMGGIPLPEGLNPLGSLPPVPQTQIAPAPQAMYTPEQEEIMEQAAAKRILEQKYPDLIKMANDMGKADKKAKRLKKEKKG